MSLEPPEGSQPRLQATTLREFHGRILLLYREVISGRLNTRGWGYAEDHGAAFFAQMHQALRLLYGRANLAEQRQHSEAEDVMAFTNQCTAEHLFDFIEASFKLDVSSRMFGVLSESLATSAHSGRSLQCAPDTRGRIDEAAPVRAVSGVEASWNGSTMAHLIPFH